MPKDRTVYICTQCGFESPKWYGKCTSCGEWNTMQEEVVSARPAASKPQKTRSIQKLQPVSDIQPKGERRLKTGLGELDRVLGGGIVPGSLVLIGGDPGIGKSTLLLQICRYIDDNNKILYVSGEESLRQIKLRADRLGIANGNLYIVCETDVDTIIQYISHETPDLLIIDSKQTMTLEAIASAAGSVTQVRESTSAIMKAAKAEEIPAFIVSHVNKDGAIAGEGNGAYRGLCAVF